LPVTGPFLVVSMLMVVLGIYADPAFLLQAVYPLAVAVLMHDFRRAPNAEARMREMTQFSKNVSRAGAALMLFAFFGLGRGVDIDPTITDSLLDLSL
jgi:hypothetical protein